MKGGRISRITLVAIVVFATWASVRYRYIGVPGNNWRDAINGDGKGYYEYIRMFLTPGDPALHPGKGPLHPTVDAPVIKHFGGPALCMTPFVLMAHSYTLFNRGKPEDGYSIHYQIAVGIAALTFLAIGLFALRRYLLRFGCTDGTVAALLLIVTIGTGLITQAVVHPAMSHVYAFATIAMLFLVAQRLFREPTPGGLLLCAGLLALATFIRPVNVLVVIALPMGAFATESNTSILKDLLRSRWIIVAATLFAAILGLQSFLWFVQSGEFIIDAYHGEGFHWDRPHILDSLFGPRNGLFFHWPLLLLIVPGSVSLFRRSRSTAIWLLLFALPFVYVTASWWNWAYGDNFGQRTYLDMLPVFALPMALSLRIFSLRPWLTATPVILLCALNLFQSWQYLNHLLVPGQLDWRKYQHIFLTTDPQRAMQVGGHLDMEPYAPHGREFVPTPFITTTHVSAERDTTLVAFTPMPLRTIGAATHFELDIERTENVVGSSKDSRVLLRFEHGASIVPIHSWRLDVVPNGGPLEHWHYAYNLNAQRPGDTLQVFVFGGRLGWEVRVIAASLTVPR